MYFDKNNKSHHENVWEISLSLLKKNLILNFTQILILYNFGLNYKIFYYQWTHSSISRIHIYHFILKN